MQVTTSDLIYFSKCSCFLLILWKGRKQVL